MASAAFALIEYFACPKYRDKVLWRDSNWSLVSDAEGGEDTVLDGDGSVVEFDEVNDESNLDSINKMGYNVGEVRLVVFHTDCKVCAM